MITLLLKISRCLTYDAEPEMTSSLPSYIPWDCVTVSLCHCVTVVLPHVYVTFTFVAAHFSR